MLAIGRALMSKPKLLLLDEPSMGIAPLLVKKIFESIALLNKEGMTILLVEQNAHAALELAHRADNAGQNDVLAGRDVHAGGEELGGGQDHRRLRLDILKPAQMAAADLPFVGGDAADIVRVLLHKVGVEVSQSAAHFVGVLLIDAEHQGLGRGGRGRQQRQRGHQGQTRCLRLCEFHGLVPFVGDWGVVQGVSDATAGLASTNCSAR